MRMHEPGAGFKIVLSVGGFSYLWNSLQFFLSIDTDLEDALSLGANLKMSPSLGMANKKPLCLVGFLFFLHFIIFYSFF